MLLITLQGGKYPFYLSPHIKWNQSFVFLWIKLMLHWGSFFFSFKANLLGLLKSDLLHHCFWLGPNIYIMRFGFNSLDTLTHYIITLKIYFFQASVDVAGSEITQHTLHGWKVLRPYISAFIAKFILQYIKTEMKNTILIQTMPMKDIRIHVFDITISAKNVCLSHKWCTF